YYAFSTLLCVPNSLAQEVGVALGAQAGEARIREAVEAAGFTRFRRVAESLMNAVYEVRP
ncbi:MAG TPA: SAM-dependent methyltransferase, partial [Candidatus Binatia bacterium]|nr:SAM-dependent methyltransferase [Candidatus Binatia bacterium]